MKLDDAAGIFRQIISECPKLDGKNFLIMIPEPTEPVISKGYEIIIRTNKHLDGTTDQSIHAIAMEHDLRVIETPNLVALYTPTDEI